MKAVPSIARVAVATACAVFVPHLAALAAGQESEHDKIEQDTVLGGDHWRLTTRRGVVHVWAPRLYDRDKAGILIYIHGYYVNADQAWNEHHLAQQFRDSKQNALFIVPEAPISDEQPVVMKDLDELLYHVRQMTRHKLPPGAISVLAHSGGFRTVVEWLDNRDLSQIILLDGLYENEAQFTAWLKSQKKKRERVHGNRLIVVASETIAKSDALVKRFPKSVTHDRIPDHAFELSKTERAADVLYMRTTEEHMQLVTDGRVIPLLIKLAPFSKL
jgi:hypothetical protein